VHFIKIAISLDEGFIRNRSNSLRNIVLGGDMASITRLSRKSLEVESDTSSLGFLLLLSVGLDTVQEFLTALGVSDVFNTDINTLFNVAVTNDLVNNNTDRGLGNVVDDTSTTVVELVRHTLLDSSISLDVNNVTDLVSLQVGGERDDTMFSEVTREHVTSTSTD
jgi:hypothetical protein